MEKEIRSCEENHTWTVVPRPTDGRQVIRIGWVFKTKLDEMGNEDKLKARITPKGYMQVRGQDYYEIFAPTVRYKTLRILLSLITRWDFELHQLDVSSAFLHADVKEDVYVEIPEGYTVDDSIKGDFVLKLNKALYGIHQAPREWYLLVRNFIVQQLGFTQCTSDACLFVKRSRTDKLILLVMFVDDYQVGFDQTDMAEWLQLKKLFMARFKTSDIGESKLMLGMRITRDREKRTLILDQEVYSKKVLEKFNMQHCKDVSTPEQLGADLDVVTDTLAAESDTAATDVESDTNDESREVVDRSIYMQLVGALLYATLSTRPDIAHAVHQLTRYTQNPQRKHWQAAKRVLRYLQGTADLALIFGANPPNDSTDVDIISGYADADWANDKRDRKSITGWVVKLNGDVVNWACKKQQTIALSTCEAELYAEAACTQEVLWLRHLLSELSLNIQPQSVIWGDNQSTLQISEHGIIGERTKHIDIKYKFITECIETDEIKVAYVRTDLQQADILTKALSKPIFERHRAALMTR
jgi:Reverse transcriptase (RNA-dependent DNA polymerase)